ncbi:MAG: SGNH/GDSL hydrolase family protein [Anaerolineae bacterium]|nr:SGNH/GDSL hydrolase family protein [Anaerolineae bacterium]NUQ02809.1 SGNH/GDSL hydrolase family protein [Anaerolineae bacterium]
MTPVILSAAGIGAALAAGSIQRRWDRLRTVCRSLLVSFLTLVFMFGAGEVYFRYLHADSEGTLAKNNWIARFWHVNSFGYRDVEWAEADLTDRQKILVIGDSFTAGWGIQDPQDRFSNVLARTLGEDYAVFNAGVTGTSTAEQAETLRAFPIPPDIVIWQYFLNDIEYTLLRLGLYEPPPPLPAVVSESYLTNYLYSLTIIGLDSRYWQHLYAAYDSALVWNLHAREIDEMVHAVQARGVRLILVIFPNMADPFGSIAYVDRVVQAARSAGVTDILTLFDAAEAMPLADRIVSPRDAHPSAAFHRYVGERLAELFFAAPSG